MRQVVKKAHSNERALGMDCWLGGGRKKGCAERCLVGAAVCVVADNLGPGRLLSSLLPIVFGVYTSIKSRDAEN